MHQPYNMVQYLAITIGVLAGVTLLVFYKEYKNFKRAYKFIVGCTMAAAVVEIIGASLVNAYTDDPTVGLCLLTAAILRLAAFKAKKKIVPVVIAGLSVGARGTASGLTANDVALARIGFYDPTAVPLIIAGAVVFAISAAITIGETVMRAKQRNVDDDEPTEDDPLLPKYTPFTAGATMPQLPHPTQLQPVLSAPEKQKLQMQIE